MTAKQDEAYHKFKEAIFNRVFETGHFLTQTKIVKELGVSLGPLRGAMKRLEWEKLILVIPQSGIQIAVPNINDIKEAFQLRTIIEKESIRCFTKNPSPISLEKLEVTTRTLIEAHSEIAQGNDVLRKALEVDYALHITLIEEMKNKQLKTVFQIIFDKIRIAWLSSSYTPDIIKPVMKEHIEILEAIKKADPDLAAQAMENHLTQSLRRIMGV